MENIAQKQQKVITRFAPSPTGFLHIGGARTALFNYLFAKQNGGIMILRIEDTDRERSKKEYENSIFEGLSWLGIKYDEFYYRQSERTALYQRHIEKMIEKGTAYISKEDGRDGKRSEVIRFKNPKTKISFEDIIRGKIEFDVSELGDFVIAKDIESPLYHLAVVVDDFEMGVTHIIRGEDGISNTPRQILIQEAIDAPRPRYAHIPLILAPDRSKLSKRHGAVSLLEFRDKGFVAPAIVNFLALLGWHPKDESEILSMSDLIAQFSLPDVQKGGAVFNMDKLRWINREYLERMSEVVFSEHAERFMPEDIKNAEGYSLKTLNKLRPLLLERISTFGDIRELAERGELLYFFSQPLYEKETLFWKGEGNPDSVREILRALSGMLDKIPPEEFGGEYIKQKIFPFAEEKGKGSVLWPMRVALSGLPKSPDPFTLAAFFGKDETLRRLAVAEKKL
ncbi:glutamate--tRNA ligase [bacterium]|nr:glutamate--tRNA ligase [bacterium]